MEFGVLFGWYGVFVCVPLLHVLHNGKNIKYLFEIHDEKHIRQRHLEYKLNWMKVLVRKISLKKKSYHLHE